LEGFAYPVSLMAPVTKRQFSEKKT
jgi:hypothetical protein